MSFVPKKVSVSLPFGIGSVEWEVDQKQSRAAWSLYVELSQELPIIQKLAIKMVSKMRTGKSREVCSFLARARKNIIKIIGIKQFTLNIYYASAENQR